MKAIDAHASPRRKRLKVVLYNPQSVFFTMPLALLAIGSELDPAVYEVVTVDARLDPDAESTVCAHIGDALCLGVTVLTSDPNADEATLATRAAMAARAGCGGVVCAAPDLANFRRKVLTTPGFVVPAERAASAAGKAGRPPLLYRRGPATYLDPPFRRVRIA